MSESGPNDAQERLFPEENNEAPEANDENENSQIAYGLTIYVTVEGNHGMSPIGDLTLLDTIGLLYRSLVGAQSQMYAQAGLSMQFAAAKDMAQSQAQNKSKIIVPDMAPPPDLEG